MRDLLGARRRGAWSHGGPSRDGRRLRTGEGTARRPLASVHFCSVAIRTVERHDITTRSVALPAVTLAPRGSPRTCATLRCGVRLALTSGRRTQHIEEGACRET